MLGRGVADHAAWTDVIADCTFDAEVLEEPTLIVTLLLTDPPVPVHVTI